MWPSSSERQVYTEDKCSPGAIGERYRMPQPGQWHRLIWIHLYHDRISVPNNGHPFIPGPWLMRLTFVNRSQRRRPPALGSCITTGTRAISTIPSALFLYIETLLRELFKHKKQCKRNGQPYSEFRRTGPSCGWALKVGRGWPMLGGRRMAFEPARCLIWELRCCRPRGEWHRPRLSRHPTRVSRPACRSAWCQPRLPSGPARNQ